MTPGGRLAAAIEVLEDVQSHHRPVSEAVRDWGRTHRFAGSSDRAAILNLVNACLRKRASLSYRMGDDTPRALVLGCARFVWDWSSADMETAMAAPHAPPALSEAETAALESAKDIDDAPAAVRAELPDWLFDHLSASETIDAVETGAGLAARAPLDLRVNTLKTTREKVIKALTRFRPEPTPLSPVGLRMAAGEGPKRLPAAESDPAHGRGGFEVQDEGSQIAALMVDARPGQQVVDYCAGAGGKTLAMAAAMQNRGQIHAHDANPSRLRPIVERLKRAGVRNVQTVRPGDSDAIDALGERADRVLVDAPCSGSGTWRRKPDTKWRLTPEALERRCAEQATILGEAAPLVRPGGRLTYVTCSVLECENYTQIQSFISSNPDFTPVPYGEVWRDAIGPEPPRSADGGEMFLTLTPHLHGTDGFFIAVLERRP